MLVYFWLLLVFVIGAIVGSFLNVVISRVPLEKSILWPNSRCGHCLQSIPWYHNLPLVSYVWLRGRCRICQTQFSPRYFFVELCTGLAFAGLFYVEVVLNVHGWPPMNQQLVNFGIYPWQWWVGYSFHAVLLSFLLAVSVCDLETREIPFSITLTGAIIGLIGAALMPWPWPAGAEAIPRARFAVGEEWLFERIGQGVYPWPAWGPLPDWLPLGSAQLGLATGLAGFFVGTLMLRAVGFLFSKGLGREALGLGDADLMMMAGCFLGWQLVVAAFFVSVVPALFFGLFQLVVRGDHELPFGPSLSAGLMIALLTWTWLGPPLQFMFFHPLILLGLAGFGAFSMLGLSYVMRIVRGGPEPGPDPSEPNGHSPLQPDKVTAPQGPDDKTIG